MWFRGADEIRPDSRVRICKMNPMLRLNGAKDISPYNTFQQSGGIVELKYLIEMGAGGSCQSYCTASTAVEIQSMCFIVHDLK